MEAAPLLIPLIIAGIAVAVRYAMQTGTTPPWQLAANRLGLAFRPAGLIDPPKIHGRLDGFEVEIEIVHKGAGNSRRAFTKYVVDGGISMTTDVALASETFWSSLDLMGAEIEVGDRTFDDAVRVRGVESTILAVLDQPTRSLVSTYVGLDKGHVKDGRVTCERVGREKNTDALEVRIRRMVTIAKALCIRDGEAPGRLANNVENDGHPKVRHRNLQYLTTYFRRHEACEKAALTGIQDGDAHVRVLAAKALGARGSATLEALVLDESVEPTLRADALQILAKSLPREDLVKVTRDLLDTSKPELLLGAIRVAEKERLNDLEDAITARTNNKDKAVVEAAARALGVVGGLTASATLVNLLEHVDDAVKIAACDALCRVGAIDTVEMLLEHTKGLFRSGDVKRAARAAVDAIQTRVGDADAGRLSVVDGKDAGALSVSHEAGAVALVDEDD